MKSFWLRTIRKAGNTFSWLKPPQWPLRAATVTSLLYWLQRYHDFNSCRTWFEEQFIDWFIWEHPQRQSECISSIQVWSDEHFNQHLLWQKRHGETFWRSSLMLAVLFSLLWLFKNSHQPASQAPESALSHTASPCTGSLSRHTWNCNGQPTGYLNMYLAPGTACLGGRGDVSQKAPHVDLSFSCSIGKKAQGFGRRSLSKSPLDLL